MEKYGICENGCNIVHKRFIKFLYIFLAQSTAEQGQSTMNVYEISEPSYDYLNIFPSYVQ
jgi:hypothetical protein